MAKGSRASGRAMAIALRDSMSVRFLLQVWNGFRGTNFQLKGAKSKPCFCRLSSSSCDYVTAVLLRAVLCCGSLQEVVKLSSDWIPRSWPVPHERCRYCFFLPQMNGRVILTSHHIVVLTEQAGSRAVVLEMSNETMTAWQKDAQMDIPEQAGTRITSVQGVQRNCDHHDRNSLGEGTPYW